MASPYVYTTQSSSHRGVGMVIALISAIVLSPLYVQTKKNETPYETRWNSGLVLPMVLAGLIIAIKTSSSSSSSLSQREARATELSSTDPSRVLRIGGSSWGLAGVLIMLMVVLSWQDSVQHFFWR